MSDESTPAKTVVEMNQLVLPQHTNALGTAFGGTIMSWIDICAAMSAQRHARKIVVTVSMDQIHFIAPIRQGQLVSLRGMVNWVGRTSLEVGVRVDAENTLTGERAHSVSAYVTFVAIDESGRPTPVRPLVPTTPEEKVRWAHAEARRQQRLDLAAKLKLLDEQNE